MPAICIQMVELFLSENADAVFGSRFMPGGYKRALFFRHQLGNKFLTFLCDLVCDLNFTDMETCYKMVRAEFLKSIPLTGSRFDVEPELAIKIAKRGGRIFEVPISYSGRTYRKERKSIGRMASTHYGPSCITRCQIEFMCKTDMAQRNSCALDRAPRFTRWMADVIRPFVGDRVLEIGAGTGNMSAHLMPRSIYWATDVNSHYLDHLWRLCPTRPYMRVAYTDAENPETFPVGQSFDTVVCLNVVEHVQTTRPPCGMSGTCWSRRCARSSWFPAVPSFMEPWMKFSDISADTLANS